AELLMGQGAQVVSGGCRFEYAEVERLLRGLADRPTHIVHFGGVGETGSWEAHFFDWLYLMQGLDNLGWTDNVTLTAVTTGMQAVQADDLIDPNKAVLNGPLRVIPLEYPGVMCRQVDFDQFNAGLLLAEWGNGVEPAVAYRDSKRFVPTLKQVVLPAAVPELQDDGVYLITGGLGSMGQAFAQYLVEHTKRATIVLTGRRPEQGSGADEFDLAGLVEREAKLIEQMAVKTLKHYGEFPRLLDEYCASLVLNYWRECGIDVSHGRSYSETELQKKLNLLPVFAKFYRFFVAMLIEDDLLVVENETLTFKDVSIVAESAELRQKLLTGYPQFAGLIHYLSHCAQYYRPALSGEMPAINVLYPDGAANSLQRTEAETVEHRHDRLYLHLTADWLAQLEIETRASRGARPFRVLEVGGGNGNLTLPVVEALAANHGSVEYYFTDVGRSFVNQAREQAAGRGVTFMRFEVLDISVDPIAQGFSAGYFDAIIGYNVVHTVPNVEQALGHLDMLLAPTGVLGLVETVNHRRWDTLVWGLAEGWWYFEEERLTPLIDLNGWRAVVSHRFSDVHTFPEAVNDGDAGLIIGRKKITSRINELAKTSHSQLVYMQADIADRTEMGGIVEQIHAKYGAINGVIHTAGVLGQGLIRQKQRNQVEAVMNAKVTGTKILSDLLQADPLDFYLLCGSMSSIAPIAGQIDYCAANSYLDAIAHLLRSKGVPATAIDWGFWQALGMIESADMLLADKLAIEHQIESNGWAQAGVAAFERILANGSLTQVVVSPDPVRQGITHPLFDHYYTDERGRAVYVAYLSGEQHWLVDEHRLDDAQVAVVPGTGHLELMRAAYSHATGHAEIEMQDVHFIAPLAVVENEYENGVQEVRIILQNNFIRVVSKSKADLWVEHVQATIKGYQSINRGEAEPSLLNPNTAMQTIAVRQDMVPFGPRWHCLRELAFSQDGGRALLELPAEFWGDLHHYQLHPALLDMATGFLTLSHGLAGSLPFSYGTIEIHKPLPARIISHATLRHEGHATVAFDVTITDEAGALLVQIFDYKLRRIQADPVELAAISAIEEAAPAENFQVGIGTPGLLDTLYFEAATRQAPAAGEVEIEIVAAGLNFIEVLFALGMLPDPGDARFGLECAGRISRVGAGVTQFAIGDEVMAFASGCFARFATVPTKIVAHKPAGVTLAEAATIPAVFTTAYYALVTRGQLTAGEKVLIHSASGGVGMAAVQIAQWIGAEVYATAGSEEKRERVRQLGVKHVSDSRSLAFADEILAATDGYGVDVVLNALGGEFIDKNLELLAYYGRFLEIGKRDVFKSTQLDMRHFSKSLAFLVLDVGPDMPRFNEVWRAVSARFEAEDFRPLPNRMFPMSHAAEAMQFMAQAQHIGKVVLLRDEKIDLTTQVAQLKREPVGLPLAVILGDENNDSRPVQKGQNNPALNPQKLDHTADNKYARPDLGIAYIAPRSDSEQTIANIWQDLLGIAQIGVEDDFFDLRGDSLLAAQVISRIHQKMGTRLPLSALFDTPTIAGLATMLLKSESESKSENNNQADFDFDMEEGEI
ncbi:MAG: NADPH:quinone reductase-like Zn-dependent oxidoreductase/NAD(P)-dependent dehydrogenase (short-subunit alcohol dehydrogenase family)/ubiquinone, partial [Cellvibrionaceae bacterium]